MQGYTVPVAGYPVSKTDSFCFDCSSCLLPEIFLTSSAQISVVGENTQQKYSGNTDEGEI